MKRKVFIFLISDCASLKEKEKRLKGQRCVESKTDFLFTASLRCCFSSQLNAIKMFNLSSFLLLTCERSRDDDDDDEMKEKFVSGEKRAITYHQRVTVRNNNIADLISLLFSPNQRNASTLNVMFMCLNMLQMMLFVVKISWIFCSFFGCCAKYKRGEIATQ